MDSGYPILVILTNKECSHCVKMRGDSGWPSQKLEAKSIPQDRDVSILGGTMTSLLELLQEG